MAGEVNRDLRAARRADTESRLVRAATELFVERGYVATTLADVAARAGVAPRTVYVRFATKVALLQRCLDVAIGGDTRDIAVPDRDWFRAAMTAPGRADRIREMARITAWLMARSGPLLRVAQQAEALEPEIAARAEAARDQTRRALDGFWRNMAADGLLPADAEIDWLADTGSVLGQAETYLLLDRTTGWDDQTYEAWLVTTWTRLADAASRGGR
ncbi:TetR/AcrR family transcriptional regulator [Pseudonocardia sp. C8]|uniref:TetR/AcrR family transcriptional regulator n=1 Tax=Pseudonocardia sp. C8 TaxID=2762759 RepID=UPI00164234B9|nr:TetR/AcrR family transcriptional regulator [Pseudonocardia sp. C8]MBC3191143.1 TetR/AcrR family transcriptional regulator [Pseudonocardia sp. C8]